MSQDQPSTIQDPTALDILRYRYHHGTNLGSIYVLERWLFPSRFPEETKGTSELDAVETWVEQIGVEKTKALFEKAWEHAVSDDDIEWLKDEAKCTTIRLPIGYYDLLGLAFTYGTSFEPYSYIYSAAWANIRTLLSRLRPHSIGVLIDLHAFQSGADAHFRTSSGVAEKSFPDTNSDLGLRCVEFVASEAVAGLGIVGLQLMNEPQWESQRLYECGRTKLNKAVEYALSKNIAHPVEATNPIVVDTHLYCAFSAADKVKTPQEVIAEVPTTLTELDGKEGSVIDRGAVQVIVGEYSNALTEESWINAGETSRQNLVEKFGTAQSQRYQARTGGAFFWTLKMDCMPGGERGFKAQAQPDTITGKRGIVPPVHAMIPSDSIFQLLERARYRCDERMYAALPLHHAYWDHLAPNSPAEYWRFENGRKQGYRDAYVFFEGHQPEAVAQGNKIENLELWILKRIRESGLYGEYVWEYEQGLRRGDQDFNAAVEI